MSNKPMLSVGLLPCPFCGSPASLEDHRLVWCVRCTKCNASTLGDRAPEPHGDGVSSDEIQDAQAAEMAENTDWAAYEKSAVDAWNSRSTTAARHQGEPVYQAVVMPDFESACGHLVEAAKDSNGEYINSYAVLGAQIWELAMSAEVVCKGDMRLNSGCNRCSRCESQLFEAAYRAQSTGPAFIVDDALLKDADGNYFHLATRQYFKFFKMGRESWTN